MPVRHTNNSWGRTRSPKNLAGAPGTEITVLDDTTTLVGITASTAGYATENQRYLHVLVEDATGSDADPAAVTIFGYCHAFQRWFEIPESEAAGEGQNTASNAASIDVASAVDNAAPAAQVPSDREYRRYVVDGIDRVAFVHATGANVNVFAACSTF
jgi:hypothetical protein